jgi:hypothetical protein
MTRLVVCICILVNVISLEAKAIRFRAMWRDDPATSMVIGWDQVSGSTPMIHYDEVDNGLKAEAYRIKRKPDHVVVARGLNNHFARLTGLKPNTLYYFLVKDSEGLSRRYSFRTAPNVPTERLSIISGGDSRNNREARILVGSRFPFISSTRLGNDVAVDRSVQYEQVGTQLTLVPTINDDGYISVQLLQEVSSLTAQTIAAAQSAPVISTREASTRAILRDGQTVVIAGLIGETRQTLEQGLPLLKDIPFLGALFKRQSITRQRTELAIFVTPYLVRTDAEADAIRERVRKRLDDRSPGVLDSTPLTRKPPE